MFEQEYIELLKAAYDGMRNEVMSCPWCGGHIGGYSTWHYRSCAAVILNLIATDDQEDLTILEEDV